MPLRRARWLALPCTALFAACSADHAPAASPAGMATPAPAAMDQAAPAEAMPATPPLQVAEPAGVLPADGQVAQARQAAGEAKADMPMWAPVREFPAPVYDPAYEGPRTDFRETIFWKPSIQTDNQGRAQVSFFLSDAVTSFRAGVEGIGGGKAGRGEAVLASRLPVSLAAKLPLEVTTGDRVELPVVVTNATFRALDAQVSARTGPALAVKEAPSTRVRIEPQQSKTVYYDLTVAAAGDSPDAGKIALSAEGAKMTDSMERVIKVVAPGFPRDLSGAGTLVSGATSSEEIELGDPIAGTLTASIGFFPTPKATLAAAAKGMLAEPGGCFEQTSSNNYPNVMVAGYLKKAGDADPETAQRLSGLLERGYQKLAGYESKNKGYEWFGEDPGHEALTAYGLLEFVDMGQVYKGVDQEMVNRTRAWLKSRRDGKGGYQRSSKALDSFGRAGPEVTNAYITWALAEAGEKDMDADLDHVTELAKSTNDTYILALSAGALAAARPGTEATKQAISKLAAKQSKDGDFPGAAESITQSGGIALSIETTALAAMSLQRAGAEQRPAVSRAVKWIEEQRSGSGSFGSTQATVLALRALTRAAEGGSIPEGSLAVTVNGHALSLKLDPKNSDGFTLGGLAQHLKPGKNTISIAAPGVKDLSLPYSIKVAYSTLKPPSSAKTKVAISVTGPDSVKVGQSVKLKVEVANTTGDGLPMVIARIGVPGGAEQQKWQLDELKKKGLVDFYETREREVIVYFRSLAPQAKKRFDLDLLASVPGTFTAPASQVYLYYTDEHRRFVDPVKLTIKR